MKKNQVIRSLLAALVLVGISLKVDPAAAGPTCTCQYFGQHLKVGTQICMKSWKGMRVATCGLELNNTSWKISDQKCSQGMPMAEEKRKTDLVYLETLIKQR